MKTLPTNLAAHIATRDTTLATALKITRADGAVYGFTSHDVDDIISGVTYLANPGLDLTAIVIAANAAVGNLEITTLHDGTTFAMADVLGGVWRNAAFVIFRYNWASLADGIDTLLAGTLGEFELKQNSLVIELRDLRQYLQQSVGDASSRTCRARLGDSRCTKDLTAFTYSSAIGGVNSNQSFRLGAPIAAGWFDEGQIRFTSGENNGLSARIKSYAADGWFTLALPMTGLIAIGDSCIVVAGCRKRLEDCRDKFDNVINFVGEPHRKGLNSLTKSPLPTV